MANKAAGNELWAIILVYLLAKLLVLQVATGALTKLS